MKTLLFSPCYLDEGERLQRNIKWIDYYNFKCHGLKFYEILLVDNASSKENKNKLRETGAAYSMIETKVHLERSKMNQYPYWYSAFGKAAKYALDNNYDKIVHIDSDVFLLSQRIVDHVNNYNDGWLAYWSEMNKFPESTFQIIAGKKHIEDMYEHMTRDFLAYYPNEMAETHIPFTEVNKNFIGDRYPEKHIFIQDPSWDYVGQTPVSMKVGFNE